MIHQQTLKKIVMNDTPLELEAYTSKVEKLEKVWGGHGRPKRG
jgi:hypothetical protein